MAIRIAFFIWMMILDLLAMADTLSSYIHNIPSVNRVVLILFAAIFSWFFGLFIEELKRPAKKEK